MTASPSPAPPQPGRTGRATVVVIGAGQAGLSAAYHLRRRGFVGLTPNDDGAAGVPEDAPGTFVVLDAETAPGGAWQHRW
ncbi:FAD-binding protein, partial [Pseudomonas aeruginosa]